MIKLIKYIYILLFTGFLLTSCSSEETVTTSSEMKFGISDLTRASTSLSNITEKPFALFGDMIPSMISNKPSEKTITFNNTSVEYNGSRWISSSVQYWANYNEHSFVAIHPLSTLSSTGADAEIDYSDSRLSFTYSIPTNFKETSDILAATHRRKYIDQREFDESGNTVSGTADVVYFRFGHIMSIINIAPAFDDKILTQEDYIDIIKFELTGFKNKALFSIAPAPLLTADQTDDREIEVTGQQGEGVLQYDLIVPKRIMNDGKNVNLFEINDEIIMIPQTFSADSDAKIIIYYTVSDDATIKQIILPLKNQKWETGKSYTYRFTLDRKGPHFETTTISDWDILNVGNIDMH